MTSEITKRETRVDLAPDEDSVKFESEKELRFDLRIKISAKDQRSVEQIETMVLQSLLAGNFKADILAYEDGRLQLQKSQAIEHKSK